MGGLQDFRIMFQILFLVFGLFQRRNSLQYRGCRLRSCRRLSSVNSLPARASLDSPENGVTPTSMARSARPDGRRSGGSRKRNSEGCVGPRLVMISTRTLPPLSGDKGGAPPVPNDGTFGRAKRRRTDASSPALCLLVGSSKVSDPTRRRTIVAGPSPSPPAVRPAR